MDTKTGMPTWLKIIGGCAIAFVIGAIAIFAVIFGTAFKLTSGPTDAAENFLTAIEQAEYEQAYDLTSPALQEAFTQEDLEMFAAMYPVLTDMTDVTFNNRSVDNNLATVYGTIEGTDETSPILVELEMVGDDWLVTYISLNEEDIPVEEEEE